MHFVSSISVILLLLPVILALQNAPKENKDRLVEILNLKTRDRTLIYEAINIIKKSGAIEASVEVVRERLRKTWAKVDAILPESEAKTSLYNDTVVPLLKKKIVMG